MKIKKKVNEVKEKTKNWFEAHKQDIKNIGCGIIGATISGIIYYQVGRYNQRKDMGDLAEVWCNLPYNVQYDLYKFTPRTVKEDVSKYPFYVMAAEIDSTVLGLDDIESTAI